MGSGDQEMICRECVYYVKHGGYHGSSACARACYCDTGQLDEPWLKHNLEILNSIYCR